MTSLFVHSVIHSFICFAAFLFYFVLFLLIVLWRVYSPVIYITSLTLSKIVSKWIDTLGFFDPLYILAVSLKRVSRTNTQKFSIGFEFNFVLSFTIGNCFTFNSIQGLYVTTLYWAFWIIGWSWKNNMFCYNEIEKVFGFL